MDSIVFIGEVVSSLQDINLCPLQENEGAPAATIQVFEKYKTALQGIEPGRQVVLLTWLHKGNREVLTTHPRNNLQAKPLGVFATRSPDRPNPIGIHVATITAVSANFEISVSQLEVINGTPIIDIKPLLTGTIRDTKKFD